MGLAILTSSFMALLMTVAGQRQAGILKRRRATPVPRWCWSWAARCVDGALDRRRAVLLVVAAPAYGIQPPAGSGAAAALSVVVGVAVLRVLRLRGRRAS